MADARLRTLPVPAGPAVEEIFGDLETMLAGTGDALLPVPADDPVRTRALTDALAPGEPIDARVALVCATSGSTGTPKGAMLTADALHASAAATERFLGGPGRWVLALPAHHIAGIQVLLRSLRTGLTPHVVDIRGGFDPMTLPDAVESAAVESAAQTSAAGSSSLYTSLVPGQLAKVLEHPDPAPTAALGSFDAVLLGGAAVPPAVLEHAAAAGIHVVRTYGMSETAGGCVYDGLPLDGVAISIDEADSRVRLRGPQVALGYRGLPDHPAFGHPGEFRTDDAGEIDDDGRLRILGRLDEVLMVGGPKLLPGAVESALREHTAVAEAVVIGVPDNRLGTRAEAVVKPAAGAPAPRDVELREHVVARLGAHSAPTRVHFVHEWPQLPGGKIDRRAVAAAVAGGRIVQ